MIRGYPNRPSVLQGEILRLHIAGDAPDWFHICFYRQGGRLVFKARTEAMLAHARPLGAPDCDWNWPIYEYPIPRDWEAGAYVALFVPIEHKDIYDPGDLDHPEAAALFVVRNRRANVKILYKLPLLTYHAYNEIGDPRGSLYTGGYSKLTLHRPGGGVGGQPWDHSFPDYYDTSSLRQTFWHWDARFIGWLERSGLAVDYCTDLDIHENLGNLLGAYRLLISVGHDEYWTEEMRRNVAAFVETGGNVAFFSGGTCRWRVHMERGNTDFVCDKARLPGDEQNRDLWFGQTATMGIYTNNGIVFNAATTDWARVLASGEPHVEKITKNVLRHLGSGDIEHPAVQAWNQLCSKQVEPDFIEVLRESRKSCAYRIDSVGPKGRAVVAKRCRAREANIEQTIYEEILPHLPISSLTFYGCVDEPATEYRWLFLEDAEGEEFAYSTEKHRRLAASWLGRMHVSATRIPAVSRLPDRGPQHYLDHLRSSRKAIQTYLCDPLLSSKDLRILEATLSQGYMLEAHWNRVEEIANRFPRTLVHGDFACKNLRVGASPCRINLVAFDWEMAGYGIPAPDLAEASGRGVPRRCVNSDLPDCELVDYWSVVRESWSNLDLTAIKELAELGAVFRSVAAVSWASESIGRGWWPIEELRGYQADLAVALQHLGFAQ